MHQRPANCLSELSSGVAHNGLTAVLDGVGIAVVLIDAAGLIEELNGAAERMFDYPAGELPGQNVRVLMPSHHARNHDDYLDRYQRTGEAHIIAKGRKTVARKRSGQTFPIHLTVGRMNLESGVRFVGVIHDLTEHDRTRDKASRLGEIVEASINEVFIFDRNTWRFSYVNDSAVANLGYTRAELYTMTPLDVKPDFNRQRFSALVEPLLSGTLPRVRFETIHRRQDGTTYPVDIDLHLSDVVLPFEFVAITRDLSEQKSMAEALVNAQKLELLGQLTGGIAHDFNNLLTVLSGNLELLEYQLDTPGPLKLIDDARQAASMGARLTERLLSFARRSSLDPEVLDVNGVIIDLTELIRRSIEPAVALSVNLAPAPWPVRVDRSHLENALLNLALNARDAMAGTGLLSMRTVNRVVDTEEAAQRQIEPGNYVAVMVSDTGSGIRDEHLSRVFEPFFSTKGKQRGNGLGLSMLYGFVKQSGGDVSVDSTFGSGSCFTLQLPASHEGTVEPVATAATPGRPVRAVRPESAATILVVEDETLVRELTVHRIHKLGYQVLEAGNGLQALQRIAEHPSVDLVFSDIAMPGGMSGIELRAQVLERHPHVEVVLTTGYAEDLTSRDELRRDGVVILQKPYDQVTLADALERVLDRPQTSGSKSR